VSPVLSLVLLYQKCVFASFYDISQIDTIHGTSNMDCNAVSCSFKTKSNIPRHISHKDTAPDVNIRVIHWDNTRTPISLCDARTTWNGNGGMTGNGGNTRGETRLLNQPKCKPTVADGDREKTTQMNQCRHLSYNLYTVSLATTWCHLPASGHSTIADSRRSMRRRAW